MTGFYNWVCSQGVSESSVPGIKYCFDMNPMASFHMVVEAYYNPDGQHNISDDVIVDFSKKFADVSSDVCNNATLSDYLSARDKAISQFKADNDANSISEHQQVQREVIKKLLEEKPKTNEIATLIQSSLYKDAPADEYARDLIKSMIHCADFDVSSYECVNHLVKEVINSSKDAKLGDDGASQLSVCAAFWKTDFRLVVTKSVLESGDYKEQYPHEKSLLNNANPYSQHAISLAYLTNTVGKTSGGNAAVMDFLGHH